MSNLFDYLLNAFEEASQSPTPASMGYGEKRRKLIEYVRELERKVTIAQPEELRAEDKEAIRIAATILEHSKDAETQTVASDLWAIYYTGSSVGPLPNTVRGAE